jgi:hypothetical protein
MSEGTGVYVAPNTDYVVENGIKILKVIGPYYSNEDKLLYGFCPKCGLQVQRVWNLCNCGNCGERISWRQLHVENYGDVE